MHHLVAKFLAALTVALITLSLGACGEEPNRVVGGNGDVECDDDEIEEDGECVPIDTGCEDDDDCLVSGQACIDGQCVYTETQCGSVGEECDPDGRVSDGFGCEDLGRGYRCYETCGMQRVCLENQAGTDGEAGMQPFCNRGETCIHPEEDDRVTTAVCQVGECDDFFDTAEGCAELREINPEELKEGEHCVDAGNGAYICKGAGSGRDGDHCDDTSDCAEGFTCINELPQAIEQGPVRESLGGDSFCAPACDGDDMCDDGRECIGDDVGFTDGVGFCGDRCEPFGTTDPQCDDNTACVPVSSEDGVCHRETTRELELYDPCDSTEECPDNSHCFGSLLDMDEVDQDRCLPLCDPTAGDRDAQDATCPGGGDDEILSGECLQIYAGEEVGTAMCFQACADSDNWGQGNCSGGERGCRPGPTGIGWCMEVGDGEQGDSCEADSECSDGYHCDQTGDGTGVCRSYCQPDEQTNPALSGCTDDEVCVEMGGDYENLGRCHLPCDPGADNTDPNCPIGQQTCMDGGNEYYCASSGDLAPGEDCGSPEVQDCAPGLVCAQTESDGLNAVLVSPFRDTQEGGIGAGPTATCRQLCQPFVGEFGDSGCPDGYACSMVNPDGPSSSQGHCVPALETEVPSMNECPEAGKMCGDNSFCIPLRDTSACVEDTYQCIQFCDFTTGAGCTGGSTCSEGFQDGPLFGWMGLCT